MVLTEREQLAMPMQKLTKEQQLQQHMEEVNVVPLNAQRVYGETTLPLDGAHTAGYAKPSNDTLPPFVLNATTTTKPVTGGTATIKESKEQFNREQQKQQQQQQQEQQQQQQEQRQRKRPRRADKSDLGENFVAPDGGWAWLVCIAAGISNLCIYPPLQQFGFLFRERMHVLGMTSSQITTIINTNPAISACTGLLNGPMFRRFTFRQVAIAGATLIFLGLVLTAFCETFVGYMFTYSLLYGFGMGISVSSSSLAINTYFKNKRRRACGFSWTITGLGPIFLPFVVTALLAYYGVQGTVLLAAAFSLHSLVSALIYQPVHYHTNITYDAVEQVEPEYQCDYCALQHKKHTGIFSSQYLYQDDDEDKPGFEIMEPGTPMLSRANDGYFGSKLSLNSTKPRVRTISSSRDIYECHPSLLKFITQKERESRTHSTERTEATLEFDEEQEDDNVFFKPNNFRRERDEALRQSPSRAHMRYSLGRSSSVKSKPYCTCAEDRELLEQQQQQLRIADEEMKQQQINNNNEVDNGTDTPVEDISFLQKMVAFFDLDLLRDFTYVNLVMGLTIINFGELNFSILTPFILSDFGLTTSQMTTAIAVLSSMDITMRFLVPFLTEKISWDNRVFFLIGVVGIALGRTVVACTRAYPVILSAFVWIGIFKGVRTIFWPLVIPSYVPLKRLPAASGLQLLISGLFTLAAGPFVGLVRDRFDYAVTLHCLNMMSFTAAISWSVEALIRRHRRKRK